ncbi:MAG TPA: pyridoxal phosphate-dependent aminotransferase [Anaerolineales bacterium]|nr:pyridoxal phosphate-dependent aminotransferase [Anaerolineales bacterium]
MALSQLARSISESPTLALNEEARRLRERGEAVINLGIGEPKNKAPIGAVTAAASKLSDGNIKYSPPDGLPSLKKAVIRYTEDYYDRLASPENVIICPGAKQAIFDALFTLLNPQDEVILLAPYWVSYPEMVRMVYGVPVVVTPEDGTFHPRMEDIEEAVGSYTKAIVVNSPNNPSGVVYRDDFMAELVAFCERKELYLILDDIYHRLVFDGRSPPSALRFSKRPLDESRLIVINGISKLYGMTGFRIGWAVASRSIIEVMTNVQAQTASCPPTLLQAAAEGALTGIQTVTDSLRMMMENNRDVAVRELAALPGAHTVRPGGTFYCLPDLRAYQGDSVALARFLLDKARVVTVPGREFGMEGHLRLSYAGSTKEITEGIARIRWALDPEAPQEIFIGDHRVVRDWA